MTPDLIASLSLVGPELMLAVGAMALLMIGVFSGERASTVVTGLAVAILVAAIAVMFLFSGDGTAFGSAFVSDPFARFMKFLTLAARSSRS